MAATGTSSDLTLDTLKDSRVRDFVAGVEKSVAHYGDTALTFLTNLQRADDAGSALGYVGAVAVEEKSVVDYNEGNRYLKCECLYDWAFQAASPCGVAVPAPGSVVCGVDASSPPAVPTAPAVVVGLVFWMAPRPSPAVTLAAGLLPVPVPIRPPLGQVWPRRARLIAAFKSRHTAGHPLRQR